MAEYYPYFCVALLLIYSYLTDAYYTEYYGLKGKIKENLRKDSLAGFGSSSPICDLDNDTKGKLCDEAMWHLIYESGYVFKSWLDSSGLPVPRSASSDPYTCKDKAIEEMDVKIPMYWCRSRRYKKRQYIEENGVYVPISGSDSDAENDSNRIVNVHRRSDTTSTSDSDSSSDLDSRSGAKPKSRTEGIERGFFLAGSPTNSRRVYIFRPPGPYVNAPKVEVWAQLNGYVPHRDGSTSPETPDRPEDQVRSLPPH